MAVQDPTVGQAMRTLVNLYYELDQPTLTDEGRAAKRAQFEKGIGYLYPLVYDPKHGGEAANFLSTLSNSDAQRRLKQGQLTQEESDFLASKREIFGGYGQKGRSPGWQHGEAKRLGIKAPFTNERLLGAFYGTQETFSDEPYGTQIRGPRSTTGAAWENIKDFFERGDEDFAVSEGLQGYMLSGEQREDLAYRAALANASRTTREFDDGTVVEGVETPRGFVKIPDLLPMQENMAYFAQRGGVTGGVREPIQWAFHKIANAPMAVGGMPGVTGVTPRSVLEKAGLTRGWDTNVVDALGRTWPMVPVLSGNKEEDYRKLTEDPRWARALAEAHPDAWVKGATEVAGATYFLASMVPVVGVGKGAAKVAGKAAKAVTAGERASAATVAGRYGKALKDVYTAERAAPGLSRLPFVTGTGKAVAEMAWYEGFSAAVTGSQDPIDAAVHGGKLGAYAFLSGSVARSTWNAAALAGGLTARLSPKVMRAIEARKARVMASAETEFTSKALRDQVKRTYEGGVVGLSLGSIAETEAQNNGKPFNILEDFDDYLANLNSETAIHSGLGFAFATGLFGGVQYREAKGAMKAAQKERPDDWAESAREAAKDLPPEAVEELAMDREAVSMAENVRAAREALGRQDYVEGDPLPEQYGVMDLIQWGRRAPDKMADALDVASQETLRRVVAESRSLPDELKPEAAPLRMYAQDLLAKRLEKPELEQEAAQKRQEMQLDPFRETGIPDSEGLKGLGFKADRHALNAVNKYLGKEYESLKDVPEAEFWEAVNLRNVAKAKEQAEPPEVTRALETTTERSIEDPRGSTSDPRTIQGPPEPPRAPLRESTGDPRGSTPELPYRVSSEDYQGAQENFSAAFKGLSRIRQRTEQGWRDIVDPDLPVDAAENASVMRRLHDGDPTLRDTYRRSVDPMGRPSFRGIKEADAAFAKDQAYVRNAVGWTYETLRSLAREEGREAEAVDLWNAIQHRSRGESLPKDLVKRLDERGLIDRTTGKPYLTEGAEKQLAVEFLSRFNDRLEGAVEGTLPMFATPNPLSILQMGGVLSERLEPGREPVFRRGLDKITMRGWMDALERRWEKRGPVAVRIDNVLAFAKRHLIKPIWTDLLAIPETTPTTASRTGRGVRAARRILQSNEFIASNLTNRVDTIMRQMASLSEGESRLMMMGIEAKWHTRARTAEEFHRIVRKRAPQASRAQSANLLRMMRRYSSAMNDLLDYGVQAGRFSRKQADAWRSRYIPHVRPMSGKDLITHVMKGEGGMPGALGREMERIFDPNATEGIREWMDFRESSPMVAGQEANQARLMSAALEILQNVALRESELRSLPKSIQVDYEPMATRPDNLPIRPGETVADYNKRIANTRTRQIQWGEWLDKLEKTSGRGTGKAPLTPGKRKLLAGMENRYIDSNTAKELELLFNYMEPGSGRSTWLLAEVNQFWKGGKTRRNPSHLLFNVNSSVWGNWLFGSVGPEQFVRMLVGGGGPYADGFRAVSEYYDWAFSKGTWSENAPMDFKALEGHPAEQSVRMFHSFLEAGGMTTHAHLFLDTVTARDLLDGLTRAPETMPEFKSARDQHEWSLAEMSRRMGPATSKLDEGILKMLGSPDPKAQAQAIRVFDSYYQVIEQAFKFAATLGTMRRSPNMTLREATERSLSGTADYGSRNPHLYQWMSLMQMTRTESQRRAQRALRDMRGREGYEPRTYTLEEGRIFLETSTPEFVKGVAKFATAKPFFVYPHVFIPAMLRKTTSSPMNMVRAGTAWATSMAIAQAFGGNDDDLQLEMAGGAEFPDDEAMWAVPSVEAIDELERTGYFKRIPPWLHRFGSDPTGDGVREWMKQPNKYSKMWKEILLESRKRAISRAPSRGQESRYFDHSEFMRPVSTVADTVHGVSQAMAKRVPFWHANPFLQEQTGYMGSALIGTVRNLVTTFGPGRKGRTTGETAFEFVDSIGQEMPQIFPGILGFTHPKMRRFAEEGLLKGQRFQDVLAGIEDPTINRQSAGERLGGAVVTLLGRTRKVPDTERTMVDQGGMFERMSRALLGGSMPRPRSKDPIQHTFDTLDRRLDDQVEKIVVDGMIGHERGDFFNLDSWYAAQFGYEAYRKEDGELDAENGGMLAQWALRQEALGFDRADIDTVVQRKLEDILFNDARDEIITLARRRETPPTVVKRLWRGLTRDNRDGLLDEIYRTLKEDKRDDLNEPMWHIYDRVFHEYVPKDPTRSKKIKWLDDYYEPLLRDMPEWHAEPVKTLGPKGIDLAPSEAIEELPQNETSRFKGLESLIKQD